MVPPLPLQWYDGEGVVTSNGNNRIHRPSFLFGDSDDAKSTLFLLIIVD